jgi:hypothetical protein
MAGLILDAGMDLDAVDFESFKVGVSETFPFKKGTWCHQALAASPVSRVLASDVDFSR